MTARSPGKRIYGKHEQREYIRHCLGPCKGIFTTRVHDEHFCPKCRRLRDRNDGFLDHHETPVHVALTLFEVTNGEEGESHVRVYVTATTEEDALHVAREEFRNAKRGVGHVRVSASMLCRIGAASQVSDSGLVVPKVTEEPRQHVWRQYAQPLADDDESDGVR